MAERIYARTPEGNLEPLEEEPFSTEDELQRLIAENPHLLDGEQMRPGDPRRWILVSREKGISETVGEAARWSVDQLIIDQDAVPTLVEVKRGSNPEIRRAIVGQMLEYAAHAQQTWTANEIRLAYEQSAKARGVHPASELAMLLGPDQEPDEDAFWQNVETNLRASRLRLLFVADEIPDPLERVAEFLNAQMPGIEVMAVEIKQFRNGTTQTLVPRVLGRLAKTATSGRPATGSRRRLNRESFLEEFSSDKHRLVVTRLLDTAREAGAQAAWGSSGVSVRARSNAWPYPISVAWLFPPSTTGWMGLTELSFGEAINSYDPPPGEGLGTLLEQWANQFSTDESIRRVTHEGITGWTLDYDAAADNIDLIETRLHTVIEELQAL